MDVVSLGSSTHTRVDSAAKHIRQCKIHERLMLVWLGGSQGHEVMHRQKNMYATMKDDLVLNVNESLSPGYASSDAYPSVLSNFTSLHDTTKELIGSWYAKSTPAAFFAYQKQITDNELEDQKFTTETQVKSLPFQAWREIRL
jgi:hypothetical protein